jgi:hypothetical protein
MTQTHYAVGSYVDLDAAHRALEAAIEAGCPMDRISVLGRVTAEGDDVLGIVHPGVGKRMEVWGTQGAFWGGVAGLLAGASGAFWLPALGPVIAVGHIVGAFAGGAAGAAAGGAGLAGAAALSQLSVILHRHGLPESALEALHRKVETGHVLVIAQAGEAAEVQRYGEALIGGDEVMILP